MVLLGIWSAWPHSAFAQQPQLHDFHFPSIPTRWDEGLPMGNGWLGCMVWQKDGRVRLALDRADLWDERPMEGLNRPEFSYAWVKEQVRKKEYGIVQQYFDAPYEQQAGPTKLPGGALEVQLNGEQPNGVHLSLSQGLTTITWSKGKRMETFVHATKPEGWFRFSGFPVTQDILKLIPPKYEQLPPENDKANSVDGSDLSRLGYPQGISVGTGSEWWYRQEGWNGFYYEIAVAIRRVSDDTFEGVWSISAHFPEEKPQKSAKLIVKESLVNGFDAALSSSAKWWKAYWSKSSISVPDTLIERQYYREMYKLGCTARENGPMISLQAVWTADNGRLPPWKGDLHHDLNTQMSYWPAYTANHLPEASSMLTHLERNRKNHLSYTKRYFGTPGLNVPGVSTYQGKEMGGWIQYSCSPTTSAWLAQHYYWQWRYSGDKKLLEKLVWPWLKETSIHLEALTKPATADAMPRLPLSSSPEIFDNSLQAWFPEQWTNYDLALTRFVWQKTAEVAMELGSGEEARHWIRLADKLPPFSVEANHALQFAPREPYRQSHRHFSHLMAIYPLGLLDYQAAGDQKIIDSSLKLLDSVGTQAWCGYSFSWLAALRARAHQGEGALEALRIFAEAFVSSNSFHLNGDQSGKGYSSFTYRPFTLEGNFAFAAGLQEMLLQSYGHNIQVFPARPKGWENASFQNLRAEGAFLVSADARKVKVTAEQGGQLRLVLPPGQWQCNAACAQQPDGMWNKYMKKGESLEWALKANH
jgi:alpha-L-fucosidase 2